MWADSGPRATATQYGSVRPCIECGATPGADATFRGQKLLLLIRTPEIARGPFCRECGTAAFRGLTAYTIANGWKVIYAVLTPWIIARNLIARRRITALPETYDSPPVRPQRRAGRPIWRRKQIFGLLQPIIGLAVIGAIVWISVPRPVEPLPGGAWDVGACLESQHGKYAILVKCSGGHDGKIIAIRDTWPECPSETSWWVYRSDGEVACVATD